LLVHQEEDERAFQCGSCPKKFKYRQHLTKHVKMHTKNTDVQYVVIWEKGGSLLEATIITDGVAQDATGEGAGDGNESNILSKAAGMNNGGQTTSLQVSDADASKLMAAANSSGSQVLDLSQLQLVYEQGNPIQGFNSDQLLILQDGTIATTGGDGTATAVNAASGESTTMLDPSTLLALAAESQGEDGTIYISEENLQALAQQGVVFSYEEAAQ